MPSRVFKETVPSDIHQKLKALEDDFAAGDLAKKHYCKQKWKLMEPHVSSELLKNVGDLQKKYVCFDMTENDYCEKLLDLLKSNLDSETQSIDCESRKESNERVSSPVVSNPLLEESQKSNTNSNETNGDMEMKDDINPNNEKIQGILPNLESRKIANASHGFSASESAKGGDTKKQSEIISSEKEDGNNSQVLKNRGRSRNNRGEDIQDTPPESSKSSKTVRKSSTSKNNSGTKSRQTNLVSLFEKTSKRKIPQDDSKEKNNKLNIDENGNRDHHISKKVKTEKCDEETDVNFDCDSLPKNSGNIKAEDDLRNVASTKTQKTVPQRCHICRQLLDDPDLRLYQGHPNGAVEEFIALIDPRLSLFTGEEQRLEDGDDRPQNKLTFFSIYDKAGHLCPFDSGLIERNVLLYFSGYVKAIYEESSDVEGGIPTKDLGPINEWWVSGFDGGEHALVGFSTAYGEYYLMEPSEEYAPFMEAVREKIFLSKLVIEFLVHEVNPSYEDLLNKLHIAVPPKGITHLSEDSLLRHAQFVCDQVLSFDSSALAHEDLLITSPCMRALVKLSGVTIGKRLAMRRAERKDYKISKPMWTKATTTDLVQQNFESYFAGQLDKESDNKGPRRHRCGVCEACQHPDCGTCVACSDMVKFGGTGRAKQACVKRRCPNMAIAEADDDDMDDEVVTSTGEEDEKKLFPVFKKCRLRVEKDKITWIGSSTSDTTKTYYKSVNIDGNEIVVGDYVMIEPLEANAALTVARVEFMYEDKKGNNFFHGQMFCRATDSILGETADPQELFVVDDCHNFPMGCVVHQAHVEFRKTPENWHSSGGQKVEMESHLPDDGMSFFYQKWYDPKVVRFEDPMEDNASKTKERFCSTCWKQVQARLHRTPKLGEKIENNSEIKYASVQYMGKEFQPGISVYLKPNTFIFNAPIHTKHSFRDNKTTEEKVDGDMYPEYYRKSDGVIKGSNEETPKPFCIGHIIAIFVDGDVEFPMQNDIYFRVKKLYRPEDTHKGISLSYQTDLNMLYWSDEEVEVKLSDVVNICHIVYGENIEEPLIEWTKKGPHRFYFNQAYNNSKGMFEEPSTQGTSLGRQRKGKGKGKGKGKAKMSEPEDKRNVPEEWPCLLRKLKTLDVFAGCGGLSEGLHQTGIAETCWAVEKEEPAAHAFKLNNPNCTVFTDDCNALLKLVLNGENTNEKGQVLPKKGDVELLCGGPPCQGFSGMNRFNSREYSKFKNSLIVSYLSYCEYYRPKYFILENVRNFVSFKNSIILKLTLRCLLRMGYQCTFGILQAGNYGVPQTRRRLIILASAPGLPLPKYPEPTHVFNLRACQLSCMIDDKKCVSNCQWLESAPYRTITVRDAMSDLPEIRNGHRSDEMSYGGEPMSFFQRLMRGNQYQPILRDHICKDMAPLVEARMAHIPTTPGADWRDLPNMSVRLSDGTFTKKLLYSHHDKKNGKSSTGALRGVCVCATGKSCDPMDRQYNTLIPWCLPHTGNRHNHWAGLYGRLEWDGFFSTTVTNPEPMGKQGRVLHPEQTRVVSVRECARSQGFPDTYRFFGNILDKHRQVGNAVPPPMGAAIGYEIKNSYCSTLPSQ